MSHVINNSANTGGLKLCSCKRPRDFSLHDLRSSAVLPLVRSLVEDRCLLLERVASYHKALYSHGMILTHFYAHPCRACIKLISDFLSDSKYETIQEN
jgi:hypothetical protein